MANKKKLKKRLKHMRKIVKVGLKTLKDRDAKIAQLTSVLESQTKRDTLLARRRP